jgi:hypothetical protein
MFGVRCSAFLIPLVSRNPDTNLTAVGGYIYGGASIGSQLESGTSPARIVASWHANESGFRRERAPYLLY